MRRSRRNDSLEALITRAIRCELTVRDLYSQFAQLFSHVPTLATRWQALSEDESSHVELWQEVRGKLSETEFSRDADPDLLQDLLRVERLLEPDLTSRIGTLNDAYELAHQIEDSELNALFRLLVVEPVKEPQRKAFLLAQLDGHLERLMSLGRDFGQKARMSIARTGPPHRPAPLS